MATLLCHITINTGKEDEFEAVMREMYRCTHEEPGCIRYEYFRAAQPNKYYCLLSFSSRLAFLEHQISDHHEGPDFASMISELDMEWLDPVDGASPLRLTVDALPEALEAELREAAEAYPMTVQSWWLRHRAGGD